MGQILAIQRRTSDLLRIFVGLQTSKDSVYFLKQAVDNGDSFTAYSAELDERIEIEKGLVRHLLLGDQVHRFEAIRSDNLVLFPCDATCDGFPQLLAASKIERLYPKGWSYLKRCEEILRGREHGRFDNEEWYQFKMPPFPWTGSPRFVHAPPLVRPV
jgi:adenine-specific DNA-methyltransferase